MAKVNGRVAESAPAGPGDGQISVTTMAGEVYDRVRTAILDGTYPPGSRLSLRRLAEELGVSTMPAREALRRLQVEGLVVFGRRSVTVTNLNAVEVRQIFRASRIGAIAGCHVTEGRVTRGAKVRLVRDGRVVYDGEVASLRRFNDDVREVSAGYDCGIVLRDFADIKEGDVLEPYTTRLLERELA